MKAYVISSPVYLCMLALVPPMPGAKLISALTVGSASVNASNISGGYLADGVSGVALDGQGNIYITGITFSPTFPESTPIVPGIPRPAALMFVAKLTPDASKFLYVRRFANAHASAIQVDQAGNAYVAGGMNFSGATLANVAVSLRAGSASASVWNSFVLKLDPTGSSAQYAAYIAGGEAQSLAIDAAGNAYIAGTAYDPANFPVTEGAFQTSQQCNPPFPGQACAAAFVTKLSAAGDALVYSTLLGGSFTDIAASITVDASGAAYVTGSTYSSDFPVTQGALQPRRTASRASNAFVAKLNPTGTALVYSTYLGGTAVDSGSGIALGSDGSAYVTGATSSDDFPVTPLAFQSSKKPGMFVAFVSKLDPAGQRLIYSTLFGASGTRAIAVDAHGVAHITGATVDGLPVFRAFQPSFYPSLLATYTPSGSTPSGTRVASDAFAAALNETGSGLVYSTYLSSPTADSGLAITLGRDGTVIVAGLGPLNLGAKNPLSTGGAAFLVRLSPDGTPPYFTRQSITNAASFTSGLAAPGGAAAIFCTDLKGIAGIEQASGFPLPKKLAGIQVSINGMLAPLFSVSGTDRQQQINLQVPFEVSSPFDAFEVEISQGGVSAWVEGVSIQSAAPGLFTIDGTYGAIQHASDYSLITPANPARAGETVILYGTGLGLVSTSVSSGVPAPLDAVAYTKSTPSVTIAGRAAQVLFSGLVPGTVGLYQLNVVVPADSPAGDGDVIISFPSYQKCCIPGTIMYETVNRDSSPVKISVR